MRDQIHKLIEADDLLERLDFLGGYFGCKIITEDVFNYIYDTIEAMPAADVERWKEED